MTNKTYTAVEKFRVELEPTSTTKVDDADMIELQVASHGNDPNGDGREGE